LAAGREVVGWQLTIESTIFVSAYCVLPTRHVARSLLYRIDEQAPLLAASTEDAVMVFIVLWLLGIPLGLIVLLWLLGVFS
jgi:hypothetical protein